jgi:TRAP-type C4-dicarboxylate transport system substrate-binding protein
MVNELLEQREILADIAVELYGDMFVTNDKFWNSPTENQMREVEEQLEEWGHRDILTSEQKEAAKIIAKDLGIDFEDDEEDYLGF